jgi:serine protease DegQ
MTLRKLWLTFAQAATVALGVLFVVATLKPELLTGHGVGPSGPVVLKQAPAPVAVATGAPQAGAKPNSYNEAVQRAAPSVVNVNTTKQVRVPQGHPFADDSLFRRFFGDAMNGEPRKAQGLGSGVIVSAKGYVLTNNHVIEEMDEIEVALADGRSLKAKVVGTDPETDLAVLKVDADALPAITFGAPAGVQTGDVVLAIGNPLGVGQTVTMGIVSAVGRTRLGINTYENFIQTDAAINVGNSGGALIDAEGNLIGINTAILSRSGGSIGIGFAIPATTAQTVLQQIIESGTVTRGFIGVEARETGDEPGKGQKAAAGQGAFIARVVPDGPADRAGVRAGDVLTGINGKPILDPTSMLNVVAELPPGTEAQMKLRRGERDVDLKIVIGRRPAAPQMRRAQP